MTTAIAKRETADVTTADLYAPIKALVLDTVSSRTQRDYRRALDAFLGFWKTRGGRHCRGRWCNPTSQR